MDLASDLRQTLRGLGRRPGYVATALLTLALAIGATTAVFTLVNGVLLRGLPFPAAERLVTLWETSPPGQRGHETVSVPTFEDWVRSSHTVERWAMWRDWMFEVRGPLAVQPVRAAIASSGFFDVLGVQPLFGRTFVPEDEAPGANRVVVVSHGFWLEQLGGDSQAVGRSITVRSREPGQHDESLKVVGVLPPSLRVPFSEGVVIWAPVTIDPDHGKGRGLRNRRVLARLRPGVSEAQARDEVAAITRGIAEGHPDTNTGWGVALVRLDAKEVERARQGLWLLAAAVGLVLLVACTNLGGLALARATERRHGLAVRVSLGAGPWALARLFAVESVLLAAAGGAMGHVVAGWLVAAFKRLAPATPRLDDVALGPASWAFAVGVSLLVAALAGVAPALQATLPNLVSSLKASGYSVARASGRLRRALVVTQVTLAVVLVSSAALLTRSFVRLVTQAPGFEVANLVSISVFPPLDKYPDGPRLVALFDRLREEIGATPGVVSAAAGSSGPLFGGRETTPVAPEARPTRAGEIPPTARYFNVTQGYFRTMGIALRRGRDFSPHDDRAAPRVAIVNETMARRLWPGQDPVGARIVVQGETACEVVGVVGDTVKEFRPGAEVESEIYWPYAQQPRGATFVLARTGGDPTAMIPALRERLRQVDPDLVLARVSTMEELLGAQTQGPRFSAVVLGFFGTAALALAAIGLYGLVAYTVGLRVREIAVRLALGASPVDVFLRTIGDSLALAGVGAVIGLAGAVLTSRLLEGLLFGIGARDPLTLVGAALTLVAVAALAAFVPARRAMRVDPLVALRSE
jgi:putative ABC transport system permease protein